jgi:hypothetical protein
MRDAFDLVLDPAHLRNTLKIALVVGCVLTAINQLDVFLRGDATAAIFVKRRSTSASRSSSRTSGS